MRSTIIILIIFLCISNCFAEEKSSSTIISPDVDYKDVIIENLNSMKYDAQISSISYILNSDSELELKQMVWNFKTFIKKVKNFREQGRNYFSHTTFTKYKEKDMP